MTMTTISRCPLLFFAPADDGGGGDGDGDGTDGQTQVVGSDDSVLNIAKAAGFYWSTVWNHPKNSGLKSLRQTPEVLQEGDKLFVPIPDPKKVTKPNEARHKFKIKGEQSKFKIRLKQMGKARANEDYVLVIDGVIKTGKTDADGKLETDVANDATGGVLKLQGGKEVIPITIGRLDPHDSPSGVLQRLTNLGFTPDPSDPDDDMPKSMLEAFQKKYQLPVTGKHDGATKSKLKEQHVA